MALVKFGGGVVDARGSIGGTTFSKNRYGQYMRARTTPVNPDTDRQGEVRTAVQFLAPYWSSTLTAAQRAAWEVYAAAITRTNKLGEQIKLTGYNHFMRCNIIRVQNDELPLGNGPVVLLLPPGDPAFAVVVDEAGQQISVTYNDAFDWCTSTFGVLYVSMSIPHAGGVSYIGGPYRIAGHINGVDPGGVASPQVMDVPFPVAEGQVVKCVARIGENDGRLSDPFQDIVDVVA